MQESNEEVMGKEQGHKKNLGDRGKEESVLGAARQSRWKSNLGRGTSALGYA